MATTRRLTLLKTEWIVGSAYNTLTDPQMPAGHYGQSAPWITSILGGSVFVVFDVKGVLEAIFSVDATDFLNGGWVNALPAQLNASTVTRADAPSRWIVPAYAYWRLDVTDIAFDPTYPAELQRLNVYVES